MTDTNQATAAKPKPKKPARNMWLVYKTRDRILDYLDDMPTDGLTDAEVAEQQVQTSRVRTLYRMEGQ